MPGHVGQRLTLPGLRVSGRQGRGEGPGPGGQAAGAGRAAGPPARRARLLQAAIVAACLAGRAVLTAAVAAVAFPAGGQGRRAGPRGAHKRRHPLAVERRRRPARPARDTARSFECARARRAPPEPCSPGGACGGGGGGGHRGRPRRGWHRGDRRRAGVARAGRGPQTPRVSSLTLRASWTLTRRARPAWRARASCGRPGARPSPRARRLRLTWRARRCCPRRSLCGCEERCSGFVAPVVTEFGSLPMPGALRRSGGVRLRSTWVSGFSEPETCHQAPPC